MVSPALMRPHGRRCLHFLAVLLLLLVRPGGGDKCVTRTYEMEGYCTRIRRDPTVISSRSCHSSVEAGDACIQEVGTIVQAAITKVRCEELLSQQCLAIGGVMKNRPSCTHWCAGIAKNPEKSCTGRSCAEGVSDEVFNATEYICPTATELASRFIGINTKICCHSLGDVLSKNCIDYDCEKLQSYLAAQANAETPECATEECWNLNDVSVAGLASPESRLATIRTEFERCLRRERQTGCYPVTARRQGACTANNLTWSVCASSKEHADQCMEEAGRLIDDFISQEHCSGFLSSLCSHAGGMRKCRARNCDFLCDIMEQMKPESSCLTSASCPAPPAEINTQAFCCHSLKRIIQDSCDKVNDAAVDALIDDMSKADLRTLPCNATSPCLEPQVCTRIDYGNKRLSYCSMLNGQYALNQKVNNDPHAWETELLSARNILPENVFLKTPECDEAFRQWICAINSKPCDPVEGGQIEMCMDHCIGYQICNASLEGMLGKNGTSRDPQLATFQICSSMGVEQVMNVEGSCFNYGERPLLLVSDAVRRVGNATSLWTLVATVLCSIFVSMVVQLGS